MLRYMTAGESHGRVLIAILDGMVAGVNVDVKFINGELRLRQAGYGRGGRMKIEKDTIDILSGVYRGKTIGSPIAVRIENKDKTLSRMDPVYVPRPGHADLAGVLKYGFDNCRFILERASARETAARVAVGAICKLFLGNVGIEIVSHTVGIGGVSIERSHLSAGEIKKLSGKSCLRCADKAAEKGMIAAIDDAGKRGDTVGGVFEVVATGVPPGLGSHTQWDRRLDGRLARALMSVQAVKGVEIGLGFEAARMPGSKVHDEILASGGRSSNNAGGMEGGISNGEDIVLRGAMKPISTLLDPLASVNLRTGKKAMAHVERSDICAVPAAGVVGEAAVAFVLAECVIEKFGGDQVDETLRNLKSYLKDIRKRTGFKV